jgi:hypothetical protein
MIFSLSRSELLVSDWQLVIALIEQLASCYSGLQIKT